MTFILPAVAAASPGIGSALASAGSFLASHPWAAALASNVVTSALGGIFGGQSPYEQGIQQQLQMGKTLLPQLQQAAQGVPTMATQNIMRQIRQNTTAAQQSYAASATARGGGGTPVAAQQARFRQAEAGAMGNVLAQQQTAAMGQLTGLYGQGLAGQQAIEQMELQAKGAFMSSLMGMLTDYKQYKADPQWQELYDIIKALITPKNATPLTGSSRTFSNTRAAFEELDKAIAGGGY